MVRWCWVNLQHRGVLLIWIIVGQGPTALTVGAGGGCLDIFSLIYHFSFLSSFFWETARYRLKYCLKVPLTLKQPTNHVAVCTALVCGARCSIPVAFGHLWATAMVPYLLQKYSQLTDMYERNRLLKTPSKMQT